MMKSLMDCRNHIIHYTQDRLTGVARDWVLSSCGIKALIHFSPLCCSDSSSPVPFLGPCFHVYSLSILPEMLSDSPLCQLCYLLWVLSLKCQINK